MLRMVRRTPFGSTHMDSYPLETKISRLSGSWNRQKANWTSWRGVYLHFKSKKIRTIDVQRQRWRRWSIINFCKRLSKRKERESRFISRRWRIGSRCKGISTVLKGPRGPINWERSGRYTKPTSIKHTWLRKSSQRKLNARSNLLTRRRWPIGEI